MICRLAFGGMPDCLYRFCLYAAGHCFCLNAGCLALVSQVCQEGQVLLYKWGCQGVCHWFHKYATGSVTHLVLGFSDCQIACDCATRLWVACNHAMERYLKVGFRLLDCVQSRSACGFWGFVEMALILKKTYADVMKMKGGQDFYVDKIVTEWTVTGTKQQLNECQTVTNKIEVISHC